MSIVMRRIMKWSSIILIIGVICVVIGNALGGTNHIKNMEINFGDDLENMTKVREENIENFSSADIDFSFGEIEIMPGEETRYEIYANESARERAKKIKINVQDDTLVIKEDASTKKRNMFNNKNIKLIVYIPENELESFKLKLNMAISSTIKNISARDIDIKNTTGEVKYESLKASNNLKLELVMGEYEVKNMQSKDLKLNLNDGSYMLKNVVAEKVEADIYQGECEIKNLNAKSLVIDASQASVRTISTKTKEATIESNMAEVLYDGNVDNAVIEANMSDVNCIIDGNVYDYRIEKDIVMGSINSPIIDANSITKDTDKSIVAEANLADINIQFKE